MKRLQNHGMTLIEIMVASAIGMVVVLGITQGIQFSVKGAKTVSNTLDAANLISHLTQIMMKNSTCITALKGSGNPTVDVTQKSALAAIYDPVAAGNPPLYFIGYNVNNGFSISDIYIDFSDANLTKNLGCNGGTPNQCVYVAPLYIEMSPSASAVAAKNQALGNKNLRRNLSLGLTLQQVAGNTYTFASCNVVLDTNSQNKGWTTSVSTTTAPENCEGPFEAISPPGMDGAASPQVYGVECSKFNSATGVGGKYVTRVDLIYDRRNTTHDCGKGCDAWHEFWLPRLRIYCCPVQK